MPRLNVTQVLPYWLTEASIRLVDMIFVTIDKKKTAQVIKYLNFNYPLDKIPLTPVEYEELFGHFHNIYPDDFRYGLFRLPTEAEKLSIDLTHLKRIRQSYKYPETHVDIILTTKVHYDSLIDQKRQEIYKVVFSDDQKVEIGEVKVPQ